MDSQPATRIEKSHFHVHSRDYCDIRRILIKLDRLQDPLLAPNKVGGGVEPLPGGCDMLQHFETILPLVESL